MTQAHTSVRINYLRPPDRRDVFIQRLLLDSPEVKITLAEAVPFDPPILTPPVIQPCGEWETTDLFLDVWVDPEGHLSVLDADQLWEAEAKGWVSGNQAKRAREEVDWIQKEFAAGRWPPPVMEEWTLERARQSVSSTSHAAQRRAWSR